MLIYTTN